jgi:hypothetical protein
MSNSSLITHRSHRHSNNNKVKKRKIKRICSTCGSTKTRLHHWGPRRLDGVIPEYEQWYDDHNGGWLCYGCYMKGFWLKRRHSEKEE